MTYNIALIKGDGIGPEIVDSAVKVLEKIGEKFGHTFNFTAYLAGGCAIDATGKPLPEETVAGGLASDSVLLGAVGGPKWDNLPSFARIFYRNAINIGFPILECPEAAAEINNGDDVTVDFDTGRIVDNTTGKEFHANPLPPFIGGIVEKGGLLPYLKAKIEGEA